MMQQDIVKKIEAMAWRIQSYEIERLTRHSLEHTKPPTYTYPARWELEDFLKDILKYFKEIEEKVWAAFAEKPKPIVVEKGFADDVLLQFKKELAKILSTYNQDQHITDLQSRNTDLVEENRELKAKLKNINDLTS